MAEGHGGRPGSWLAVIIMLIGFTLGGVGLTLGPVWWMFWVGGALCVIGGVMALAVDIFSDVILDRPRVLPEREHRHH